MGRRKIEEISLTRKQTAQYNKLARRFSISRKEYLDYYKDLRKARQKSYRLQNNDKALFVPHYSLKIDRFLTDRKEFLKYRRKIKNYLQRDYIKRQNLRTRENIRRNLTNAFKGDPRARSVIKKFLELPDEQINRFLMENDDIQKIAYDSKGEFKRFLSITLQNFINRLKGL